VCDIAILNGYCTLAELKSWLVSSGNTFPTDTNDDAVLEGIIEAASRFWDGETCRYFYKNSVAETRYFTAKDNEIKVGDLVSITTLQTDDGLRTYPNTWDTDDYDLKPDNAVLDGWPYSKIVLSPITTQIMPNGLSKGVKISGVFGWPSVPVSIKEATILLAIAVRNKRFGENTTSDTVITSGGVVISPQDVPGIAYRKVVQFRKRL
jgi:hypothetical protein